jgi:hypothetical protein
MVFACGVDVPRACLCRRTIGSFGALALLEYALRHAHSTFHPASRKRWLCAIRFIARYVTYVQCGDGMY